MLKYVKYMLFGSQIYSETAPIYAGRPNMWFQCCLKAIL